MDINYQIIPYKKVKVKNNKKKNEKRTANGNGCLSKPGNKFFTKWLPARKKVQ